MPSVSASKGLSPVFDRAKSVAKTMENREVKQLRGAKINGGNVAVYKARKLLRNGKTKKYFVHRLVMNAFKPNPNPEKYTQINHKNEITYDNRLDNLEWCTQTYNNNYGDRIAKQAKALVNGKKAKPVGQYTLDGRLVKIWPSTRECERHGFKHSGVGACCLGKWPTYKGYKWKYIK
ncbi:HNH endonuclease [Lactobacillus crispatus]|uniref:HNH endonuclease n=1 Tax=Lactobacillus crispatus TaxID=47770 RepID=UPI0030F5A296